VPTGCVVGSLTGSVGIFPIAGLLCEYGLDGKGFDGGWPAIFYIFGKLRPILVFLTALLEEQSCQISPPSDL